VDDALSAAAAMRQAGVPWGKRDYTTLLAALVRADRIEEAWKVRNKAFARFYCTFYVIALLTVTEAYVYVYTFVYYFCYTCICMFARGKRDYTTLLAALVKADRIEEARKVCVRCDDFCSR
jgi:pentatricopeptide repeat protein